ncbi:hypothetical protein [Megasphaera sp.]|uniref:hypothetical protein n=1 Tax=Megasphaera sp. TaxID=2023260 RepID=UPI00257A611E|nr:hypothetical protein [Megasphaera sp.]
MIDDKMAKMAVNTIAAYCVLHRNCNNCKIRNNCLGVEGVAEPFSGLRSYSDINIFEKTCQKKAEKPPKFDITLKDSTDFREYINEIFMREAEKAGLPMNTANSIKWSTNGKIKVTFVDNDTTYVGVAKCHPNDAFNPEIGIKLAIERAAQNMRKPFTPREGQAFCYVDENGVVRATGFLGAIDSQLKVAMGNCFKTRAQARANVGRMMKRRERAIELLKTLRDEGEK